jgi:hypothetical protein
MARTRRLSSFKTKFKVILLRKNDFVDSTEDSIAMSESAKE